MNETMKQQLEENYILKNHTVNNLKSLGFYRYPPIHSIGKWSEYLDYLKRKIK